METKKFRVTIVKSFEYEVEMNSIVWNREAIKAWSQVFSEAETESDIAKIVAGLISDRESDGQFHEGFGQITLLRRNDHLKDPSPLFASDRCNPHLAVTIVNEAEVIDNDVEGICNDTRQVR